MGFYPKPGKNNPVWTGDLYPRLSTPRRVTVRVVHVDTGKPAAGVLVDADQSGQTRSGDAGKTDREGKVVLRLPPGRYGLDARPPRDADYLPTTAGLIVTRGDGEAVRMELPPACVVVLQAVDADTGKGIPGVGFKYEAAATPGQWSRVQHAPLYAMNPLTDASGKLRVIVPPGKSRFSAAALTTQNGYELPKGYKLINEGTAPVELSAGKEVRLRFEFRKETPAPEATGHPG